MEDLSYNNNNVTKDIDSHYGGGSSGGGTTTWKVFGADVSRSAVTFTCQIVILYACIITCLVNLSLHNGPNELWIALLSLSLGTILPSPKVVGRRLALPSSSSPLPAEGTSRTTTPPPHLIVS